MRSTLGPVVIPALLLMSALSVHAQTRTGLAGDLANDIADVEKKVVGLARALPEGAYNWRPGQGVRSVGEVFMHVAADNYFLPAMAGVAPPADTAINGKEYKTAVAFEQRKLTRDQIIAEVEKSFAFVKKALADTPDAKLEESIDMFGRKRTVRGLWVSTTTHMHEHLGQLIAYARSNNVVPPWSK